MRPATIVVSAICAGLVLTSCASALGTARPRLTAMKPDSVRVVRGNVTEIELRGTGFDTNSTAPDNTIRIGSLVLRAVPSSANGTLIRVAIPSAVPGAGEAPPMPWMAGRYIVTVTTKTGTSDTLTLVIAQSGGLP